MFSLMWTQRGKITPVTPPALIRDMDVLITLELDELNVCDVFNVRVFLVPFPVSTAN